MSTVPRTENVSLDPRHHSWILAARDQIDDLEIRQSSFPRRKRTQTPALPADFFPGYELRGEIHRGGQGIVYQAIQKSTGRTVAIKMLREAAFAGPTERSRFEREVQVLAALKHPNIVTIHDSGNAAGHLYFVMDFIAGRPLDAYVAGEKPPVRDMLRLFATICDAVNAAHVLGIVHRDLKPGNIRVGASGTPFVLDFGLARLADAATAPHEPDSPPPMTVTGQFVGSLPWATPEQADGDAALVDRRSDVYSLGVVLYQILTGRFPYPVAGKMRQVLDSIAGATPIDPRSLSSEIDDEVATIVLTCLAKDPARRYQSAGDLAADIRRYLAGEPIAAKRDSTWYVLRKTAARHRTPIALAALVMLLLAASTAICWSLMLRARESERDAQENLRASLLAQAQARRESLSEGRRFGALEALKHATAIRPGMDLRGAVISTLATPDILTHGLPLKAAGFVTAMSLDGTRAATIEPDGGIAVISFPSGEVIARIPPPIDATASIMMIRCDQRRLTRMFDRTNGPRRVEVWRVPEADLLFAVSDVPDRAAFDVSPDGETLAIGRMDRAIHLFDMGSGEERRRIELDRDPSYLRFDPTGHRLIRFHARDSDASILDLDTGRSIRIFDGHPILFAAAWSHDGRLIAGAQTDIVRVWDVQQNKEIGVLSGHDSTIVHLAFSPSGRLLVSEDWSSVANLWDLASQRPLLRPSIKRVVFGKDDRTISGIVVQNGQTTGAYGELTYDDCLALVPPDHPTASTRTQAGTVDPTGRIAVAAIIDNENKTDGLQFYDIVRRQPIGRVASPGARGVSFAAADSSVFALAADGLTRWPIRIAEGKVRLGPPSRITEEGADQYGVSSDGKRIAYVPDSTGLLTILDRGASTIRRTVELMPKRQLTTVSPDGRWAVVSSWPSTGGEVWDLDSGALVAHLPLDINSRLFFAKDGRLIVHSWGSITSIEPGRWAEGRTTKFAANSLRLSTTGDGRLLAAFDNDGVIHLIDRNTLDDLVTFAAPDSHRLIDCALSEDAATLAGFTLRGGQLQVWDLRRIRQTLASMGLDWADPPPPAAIAADAPVLRLELDSCSLVSPAAESSTVRR